MNESTVIALLLVVIGWAVLSEWFAARNLSGPLVFLLAGLVIANADWGIGGVDVDSSTVHLLAEITLALLLFSDASAVPLAAARHDLPLTVRLLLIGLPLSILGGIALAFGVLPDMPLALAGLLAASLAPTDAALSAAVVGDERLPAQLRRVLNVESGLNDGIATPVVTFCIAASATAIGVVGAGHESGTRALAQIGIGAAVGVGIAAVGAALVESAHRRGWMQHGARRFAALALASLTFVVASEIDGNPFVAAFVGGLAFGAVARSAASESVELVQLFGELMSLVLWFVFGAAFVLPAVEDIDAAIAIYAIGSLTLVRMVPVAVAMIGSGERWPTVAFIGWFGPRGLASIVFALLAVEELGGGDPRVALVIDTITVTVVLSVVAHGVTARPMSTRYIASGACPRAGRSVIPRSPVRGDHRWRERGKHGW